jgi:hypothetical protein
MPTKRRPTKKTSFVIQLLKFGESCALRLLLFAQAICFCAEKLGEDGDFNAILTRRRLRLFDAILLNDRDKNQNERTKSDDVAFELGLVAK